MSEQKFSRRDFLQTACISVGALSISGATTQVFADGAKNVEIKPDFPSVDMLDLGQRLLLESCIQI